MVGVSGEYQKEPKSLRRDFLIKTSNSRNGPPPKGADTQQKLTGQAPLWQSVGVPIKKTLAGTECPLGRNFLVKERIATGTDPSPNQGLTDLRKKPTKEAEAAAWCFSHE